MPSSNPMSDDLGSVWTKNIPNPPRRAWAGKTETHTEKDEHLNNLEALYGKQDKPIKYREGRPVREEAQ